jgi:hypothetical protein
VSFLLNHRRNTRVTDVPLCHPTHGVPLCAPTI